MWVNKPISADDNGRTILHKAVEEHRAGRLGEAISGYEKYLVQNPEDPNALHLIGLALLGRGDRRDREIIIDYLEQAVRLRPDQAAFHNDLGTAHWKQGRILEATAAFERAAKLDSEMTRAFFNLGNAYWAVGRFDDAAVAFARNIELDSGWVQAHFMLGNCLQYLGRINDAIEAYTEAIARRPEYPDAYLARATAYLKSNRFQEGWDDYEHRLANKAFSLLGQCTRPRWDGSVFRQKTVLVYGEQGLGDAIQFIRYLPQVKQLGGNVWFACDRSLHPLLQAMNGVDYLLDKPQDGQQLDEIDVNYYVPLLSLPRIFGTTLETIPADVPYLFADEAKVRKWQERVAGPGLKVGLAWAGNPSQHDDRFRSCPLAALAALGEVPGVTFYSLQVGPGSEQVTEHGAALRLVDYTRELVDFGETAALIKALDLVISVDSAVAHLAGALGHPVWTLLWTSHCWRYLRGREDSPWYPTMRLFHQTTLGDWEGVAQQAAAAVRRKLSV